MSAWEKISYEDPENKVTYDLLFKPEDSDSVVIIGPRKGDGVLIPGRALTFLLATYRHHVLDDLMDGMPQGYDT